MLVVYRGGWVLCILAIRDCLYLVLLAYKSLLFLMFPVAPLLLPLRERRSNTVKCFSRSFQRCLFTIDKELLVSISVSSFSGCSYERPSFMVQ